MKQLITTVRALRAQTAVQDRRHEELSNQIILLAARFDERAAVEAPVVVAEPQHPQLEVFRLAPDAADDASGEADEDEPPVQLTLRGQDATTALAVVPVPPPPKAPAADRIFQAGLDAYRRADYEAALRHFELFVRQNPKHRNADNARFWIGECHYETGHYHDAAVALQRVVDDFPTSRKIPDALFKIGAAHEKQGAWGDARKAFAALVARFPHSALADLARARLAAHGPAKRGATR